MNFLGIGSAFNTELGNNSAFIKEGTSLFLIDCGGMVFSRLKKKGILEDINKLYIIITHTHPDHTGSLGDLIFYSYYILKIKVKLIFPDKVLLKNYMTSIGVDCNLYELEGKSKVSISDDCIGRIDIELMKTKHTESIPAYGFTLKLKGKALYYSGDSNTIAGDIIAKLKSNEIDIMYQDTSGLDYEGTGHLPFNKLKEIFSKEIRSRVYCMHLDNNISVKEIQEEGFNFVEIYKGDKI